MSQTTDTIEVADSEAVHHRIPWTAVREVRVRTRKAHGAGAVKGAKIGAIAGLALTVAAYRSATPAAHNDFSTGDGFLPGAVLGVAMGVEVGVIIGAIVGAEGWKRIYPAPLRISVTPLRGPPAVGTSVRF